MSKIKRMSIKCFIYVFFLMIIPIGCFYVFTTNYTDSSLVAQKQLTIKEELSLIDNAISYFTNSIESLNQQLCFNSNLIDYMNDFEDSLEIPYLLESYTENFPAIYSIAIVSPEYEFLYSDNLDLSQLPWFFTIRGTMGATSDYWLPTVTLTSNDNEDTARVISHAYPIIDNEVLLGYSIIFIETDYFKTFIEGVTDDIMILDTNNNFFISANDYPFYYSFYDIYRIDSVYLTTSTSEIIYAESGPTVITSSECSSLDLQYVVLSDYNTFKENISISSPSIAVFALYLVLFSILTTIALSKLITTPIINLRKSMISASKGDYSIRAIVQGNDEVANLSLQFNNLLAHTEELITSIDAQNKEQQLIQLHLVQEQVKPHFLYNMLETINSLVRCGLTEESINVVSNLASFYRASLNDGQSIVPIQTESTLIKTYLELQYVRYFEFMDYILAISPNIMNYYIPKLTLQPLIENAIYHGIKEKGARCTLCVSGYLEDNFIIFEVFDTGVGMSQEKIDALTEHINNTSSITAHFGLSSIVQRLNLFTKTKNQLVIDSVENQYTCIQIKFPKISTYNEGDAHDD